MNQPSTEHSTRFQLTTISVIGKYLETTQDYINLAKTCKAYREIPETYCYNPLPILECVPQIFRNRTTLVLYNQDDLRQLCLEKVEKPIEMIRVLYPMYPRDHGDLKTYAQKNDISIEQDQFMSNIAIDLHQDTVDILGKFTPETAPNVQSIDWTNTKLYDLIGNLGLSCCEQLTSVKLPDTLERIGETFYGCQNLREVKLPKYLKTICSSTFYECSNLSSISIPSTVTFIGNRAFSHCTSLSNIVLPNGLKEIGDSCFSSCISLRHINIPSSLQTIGDYCFDSCNLTQINLHPGMYIGRCAFSDNILTRLILPSKIVLGIGSFSRNRLNTLNLSDNITEIPDECFAVNIGLEKVRLPSALTRIGDSAFYGCNIHEIFLPSPYLIIGTHAFARNPLCEVKTTEGFLEIRKWPLDLIQSLE